MAAPKAKKQPTIQWQAPRAKRLQPRDFARGETDAKAGKPMVVPGDLDGKGGEWCVGYLYATGDDLGCRFV